MRELIESKGFFMFGTCSCGGTYTEKFKHRLDHKIIIKLYPKKNSFSIANNSIKFRAELLEQKVNEILQQNKIVNNG